MDSEIVNVTIQATLLNAISGILAQGLTLYRTKDFSSIDLISFAHFLLYTIFISPLNYLWQKSLEESFPSKIRSTPADAKKTHSEKTNTQNDRPLSITNTLTKLFLDQTIGAAVNTVLFICLLDAFKGTSFTQIKSDLIQDFWPLLVASYSFWPFISLLNYTIIPFNQRPLVGSLAGLAWGVYLNLATL